MSSKHLSTKEARDGGSDTAKGGQLSGEEGIDASRCTRLRWRCRRGMLELDLLLQEFLERAFQELPETEKREFEALLDYPDPVLLDWLMGRAVPVQQGLADVVERIRANPLP